MSNIAEWSKTQNKKRTKKAQKEDFSTSRDIKRRVNITINGNVWDKLDFIADGSKSKFIEDYIKSELKKHGIET